MSGLRTLKTKINTVKSIKKIFSVMQLIATSKMKKAQDAISSSSKVIEIIKNLFVRAIDGDGTMVGQLAPVNKDAPILYIVFSSDRGLCGNYNNLVMRKVNEVLSKVQNLKLIIIGNKALALFSKKVPDKIDLENSSKFDSLLKDEKKIVDLLNRVFSIYKDGEISGCKVIFVLSKNAMTRQVIESDLFSVEDLSSILFSRGSTKAKIEDDIEGRSEELENKILYEHSKSAVVLYLLEYYLRTKFFYFIKNAYFSEVASRMIAMDNASRNSSEILKTLILTFNKKRQEKITNELVDIVNGAENA
jgi:F-type H+-transporting ATPase subunit gamma